MSSDVWYIILFLVSVLVSSISQIILKKSANQQYNNRIKEYFNVKVILAYGLFFLSSLLTMFAYKKVPLSLGGVLEATGYLWVTAMSYFWLKEPIRKKKMMGLILIILGIVVFNF